MTAICYDINWSLHVDTIPTVPHISLLCLVERRNKTQVRCKAPSAFGVRHTILRGSATRGRRSQRECRYLLRTGIRLLGSKKRHVRLYEAVLRSNYLVKTSSPYAHSEPKCISTTSLTSSSAHHRGSKASRLCRHICPTLIMAWTGTRYYQTIFDLCA